MTLTVEQEQDLQALLTWAFMARPGIPTTRVLSDLWRDLMRLDRERREATEATA